MVCTRHQLGVPSEMSGCSITCGCRSMSPPELPASQARCMLQRPPGTPLSGDSVLPKEAHVVIQLLRPPPFPVRAVPLILILIL